METKIGAGSALEPRPQSTRATQLAARGYKPPRPMRLVSAWFRLRKALRVRLRGVGAARYGASELYVAFLGGLVLAACVLVPFLPHINR